MYAFTQDVPISKKMYEQLRAQLGERPDGMLLHLVIELEKGLRYLDVWESEEQCNRFIEERVNPALERMLAAAGITAPRGEAPRVPISVLDLWK